MAFRAGCPVRYGCSGGVLVAHVVHRERSQVFPRNQTDSLVWIFMRELAWSKAGAISKFRPVSRRLTTGLSAGSWECLLIPMHYRDPLRRDPPSRHLIKFRDGSRSFVPADKAWMNCFVSVDGRFHQWPIASCHIDNSSLLSRLYHQHMEANVFTAFEKSLPVLAAIKPD